MMYIVLVNVCLLSHCCWQDLDTYQDDEPYGEEESEHYHAAVPSGWDDPGDGERPPPYAYPSIDPRDYHQDLNVSRGDSFVSSAMLV